MPEFYTAETVVNNPFLFISYSHSCKSLTEEMASKLIKEGVRLWYDKDFCVGDPWPEVVKMLIAHENCHGMIFVCNADAYLSESVHEERALGLEIQRQRGRDKFPFLLVNVCEGDSQGLFMQMLKEAFDKLDLATINKVFPVKRLHTLMEIIGPDPLSIATNEEKWIETLLETIHRRAKLTVDKSAVSLEQMQQAAHYGAISVSLGNYDGPLKWQFIRRDGDLGIFMLQKVLPDALGAGLEDWLEGEFRKKAFAKEQELHLVGKVRLLSIKETEEVPANVLKAESRWWLKDCKGAKQAVVREDGTVDADGSVNNRLKRGIRPVVVLQMDDANKLMSE